MSRPIIAGIALACLISAAAFGPLRAQTAHKFHGFKPKPALRGGSPGPGAQSTRIGPMAVAGPYATLLLDGDSAIVGGDLDDELEFGEIFIGNGTLIDSGGHAVGTWEGTVTDTNLNYLTTITLRYINVGTLTFSGAAYSDGTRAPSASAVPIVGKTGRVRYGGLGNVGLRINEFGEFVVALGGVR